MVKKRKATKVRLTEEKQGSEKEMKKNDAPSFIPPASDCVLAQSLYADGLHSIFKFLSLKDLLPSIQTCRSWRSAAYNESPRHDENISVSFIQFDELFHWPLRHHISIIEGSEEVATLDQVTQLSSSSHDGHGGIPTLKNLILTLDSQSLNNALLMKFKHQKRDIVIIKDIATRWPQKLMSIHIQTEVDCDSLANVNSLDRKQLLIDIIGCLTTLMSIEVTLIPLLDLNPFQQLPLLTKLTCTGAPFDSHISSMKHFASLRTLVTDAKWSAEQLHILCSEPQQLKQLNQLTSLGMTQITAAHMESLIHLPALTSLEPLNFSLDSLPFLPRMASMSRLHLRMIPSGRSARDIFIPILKKCVRLTWLNMDLCAIREAEIIELLTALPLLTNETLIRYRPDHN